MGDKSREGLHPGKRITEDDPWEAARKIAFQMKINHSTIIRRLAGIEEIKRVDKWISHEWNDIRQHGRM